jgi:hypothetical protein
MDNFGSVTDHTVAVYENHQQAEAAIKLLSDSGHDIKKLSIIGQDYATEEQPVGFVNTGDRMLHWGKFGAFWGYLWGLLFGSAMVFVPGAGIVLFAGWLVAGLEGALVGGGLAAMGAAFASIGIAENSVVKYQTALKAGHFVLIAHGNPEEVRLAKAALHTTAAASVESFTTAQPQLTNRS